MRQRNHCQHNSRDLTYCTESDGCWWVTCRRCGAHGPAKHSRPLALARFRSTRGRHRGWKGKYAGYPVKYTGTAARDDARFRRRA